MLSDFLRVAQLTGKEFVLEHEPCMTLCPMFPSLGQGTWKCLLKTLGPAGILGHYAETLSRPPGEHLSIQSNHCWVWMLGARDGS